MPLTNGSGPDTSIFIIDRQDANKKQIKKKSFSAYYFLKVLLHHFSKVKSQKEVATVEIKVFLPIFAE
jgi:inorganic pyrophosphatase